MELAGPSAEGELAELRSLQWASLSDAARAQFCWPPPGEPRESKEPFTPEQPSASEPLENFVLLLVKPTSVDFYCSKLQERDLFSRSEDGGEAWTKLSVNP